MTPLPVVPRERANRDVDDAIAYYLSQGATDTALRFIAALEESYDTVARHPAIGSARWGDELDIPGLRSWPLADLPFLVFYAERPDHVDVWRVLHGRRDIPSALDAGS